MDIKKKIKALMDSYDITTIIYYDGLSLVWFVLEISDHHVRWYNNNFEFKSDNEEDIKSMEYHFKQQSFDNLLSILKEFIILEVKNI